MQETRLFDADRGVTRSMRSKEEAHDYRYFPDPDLLPLAVDEAWIAEVRETLPELPDERAARFVSEMELSAYDAGVLTAGRELAEYFDAVLETFHAPKPAANWIMVSLLGWLNAEGKTISDSPVSPGHLGELLALIEEGTISGKIAKTVFEEMAASGRPPKEIVEEKGLVQMSDESAIAEIVERIVAANPGQAEEYRGGKTKLMGFFVGQVMKETKGKANPKMVNEILKKTLEG